MQAGRPYHLHYGVYRFLGAAQNPYPLLVTQAEPKIKKTARKSGKLRTTRHHSKKHSGARAAKR